MKATMLRLWCRSCGRGIEIPRGQTIILPPCDTCGPTMWDTADAPNDQKYPYVLNHNDKRFLRALKISQEV